MHLTGVFPTLQNLVFAGAFGFEGTIVSLLMIVDDIVQERIWGVLLTIQELRTAQLLFVGNIVNCLL